MLIEQARFEALRVRGAFVSSFLTSVPPHPDPLPRGRGTRARPWRGPEAGTSVAKLGATYALALVPLMLTALPARAERFEFDRRKTAVEFAYIEIGRASCRERV